MSTVLAVHPTRDDVSTAQRWGVVRYVTSGYVYGDELADDGAVPVAVVRALEVAAHEFDPRRDYLLICGDHLQLVTLSAMLGRRYGSFRALRYDRVATGYLEVLIETAVPAVLAPAREAC